MQPTYQTARGDTIVQAVVSDTPDAVVTSELCYTHQIVVEVKVSGSGMAASGSVGGAFTYSATNCDTIQTSDDHGTKQTLADEFEKATYPDGSYRVYAKSKGFATSISDWYASFECSSGGTGCWRTIVLNQCNQFHTTASEANAGSGTLSIGYNVAGWGVEGSITLTSQSSSTVKFDLARSPGDCGTHTYYLGSIAGNFKTGGTTAMIGIAKDGGAGTGDGPSGYTYCVDEGSTCLFGGTGTVMDVAYGAGDSWNHIHGVTDRIACNNTNFGDPLVGTAKKCYTKASTQPRGPNGFAHCAAEGGFCGFSGVRDVAYGAWKDGNAHFYYRYNVAGGTSCTNGNFGDPVYGTVKACFYKVT